MIRDFCFKAIFILLLLGWSCSAVSAFDGSNDTGTQILRTIVYHEITSITDDIACHNGARPMISENGERAAFVACSPDGKEHLYVTKTDGTESPRDVYTLEGCSDDYVSISPDGTKVAASNGPIGPTNTNTIWLADMASGKTNKFSLEGNLGGFKITDNGQLYFIAWGDNGIPGSNPHIAV
jgi:Tol biopolymer transport system component